MKENIGQKYGGYRALIRGCFNGFLRKTKNTFLVKLLYLCTFYEKDNDKH